MFFLSILFWLLLSVSPAWAAITASSNLGTVSSGVAGTTLALTTIATFDQGHVALAFISFDNTGTTDVSNSSEVSNVAATGVTATKLCEARHGNGGAGAGAGIALWLLYADSTLSSGGTITATFANSITAKAMSVREFILGSNNTLQLATICNNVEYVDAADWGQLSIISLTNKEYLFVRAIGHEGNAPGTFTLSSGFSVLAGSTHNTGSDVTSIYVGGEFDIATATGSASNPANDDTNDDSVSIFVALEEVSLTAPSGTKFKVQGDLF